VAKNIIANGMDNGSASKTTRGETKSAVAAGTVVITDAEGQKATRRGRRLPPPRLTSAKLSRRPKMSVP